MAFTVTRVQTVFGNKRAVLLDVTTDSASGNVSTGLSVIEGVSLAPITMVTAAIGLFANVGSAATAVPGNLNIGSTTSGDHFFLTVFGR